jgi:hypothetical protein
LVGRDERGREPKKIWYNEMKGKGLRVKLAIDENEQVGGMIEHMPIEYAFAEGLDLYFINCIWVHSWLRVFDAPPKLAHFVSQLQIHSPRRAKLWVH